MLLGAITFLVAFLTATIMTPVVVRLAWRLRVLDLRGTRKIHDDPVPRLGGIAICGAFVLSLWLGYLISGRSFTLLAGLGIRWLGYLAGAVLILLCGIVDDVRGLGAPSKFTVQFLAAGICYYAGFQMTVLTNPFNGEFELGWLSLPFTLLWIVGVTNAVNMIDGLDGLACGICLIVTATIGAISFLRGEVAVTALCIALGGSLVGFLPYNFHPARIFMGDSGSMFLGYTLAVAAMRGSQKSATAVAIMLPLLALGLPVLDTLLVMARRVWLAGGENRSAGFRAILGDARRIFRADREHVHHNLIDLGLSQQRTVWTLYGICLLFGLTTFCMVLSNSLVLGGTLATFSVGSVFAIKGLVLARRRTGPGAPVVEGLPRGTVVTAGDAEPHRPPSGNSARFVDAGGSTR